MRFAPLRPSPFGSRITVGQPRRDQRGLTGPARPRATAALCPSHAAHPRRCLRARAALRAAQEAATALAAVQAERPPAMLLP
eukprot:253400-Prymnesium_polylepis.1